MPRIRPARAVPYFAIIGVFLYRSAVRFRHTLQAGVGTTAAATAGHRDPLLDLDGHIVATASGPRAAAQRIAFRLHAPDRVPYPGHFLSVPKYVCSGGEKGALPPALARRAVLDFTATVATDLQLLFLGDSLSQQLAQGFDAAALPPGAEGSRRVLRGFLNQGKRGQNHHQCLVATAPVRGSGMTAYLRVNGLISHSNRVHSVDCTENPLAARGAWGPSTQVATLLRHQYAVANRTVRVHAFDAVVLRLPHGWLPLELITKEKVIETIRLCGEEFGAATVVVATLPLSNNVLTPADWEMVMEINQMVRDIATNWPPSADGNVRWVLVQEFGHFTNQVVWSNAQHLGYTGLAPDFSQKDWETNASAVFLDRLATASPHRPSIPMVCAEPPKENECRRNRVSADGMHWCMEYLGSRLSVSLACLLGCVHNQLDERPRQVRRCERACNDAFMSVTPVEEEWLRQTVTVFSQSKTT